MSSAGLDPKDYGVEGRKKPPANGGRNVYLIVGLVVLAVSVLLIVVGVALWA